MAGDRQGPRRPDPRDSPTTGTCAYPPGAARAVSRRRSSTCCACRASGRRPSRCSTASCDIASLDDLERRRAPAGCARSRAWARRRKQLILKALEERKQHVRPSSAGRRRRSRATALVALPRGAARRGSTFDPGRQPAPRLRDLRRHRHPGHRRGDGAVADGRRSSRYPRWSSACSATATPSRACCIRGGFQADLRLVAAGEPRRRACSTSPARRRTTSRCATARSSAGFSSTSTGCSAPTTRRGRRRHRGGHLRGARAGVDCRPSCARTAARSTPRRAARCPTLITAADLRGDLHMHTTETDGKDDLETMARGRARLGLEYIAITDHSKALAMANGLDETRALAHAARIRALNGRIDGIDAARRHRVRHPRRRHAWISPTTASPSSTSSSPRSTRRCSRSRAQMTDAAAARARAPVGRHPRPPDRPHAAQARAGAACNIERVARAAAAHGVALEINCQIAPARPERRQRPAGARARRAADRLDRRPLARGARLPRAGAC